MGTENDKPAEKLTVRQEIDKRLAALKPEQYIVSPMKIDKDIHAVCKATDEIMRLHTLREMMATTRDALIKKRLEICRDAKERILSISRNEGNEELKTPGSPLFIASATLESLDASLRRNDLLGEIVDMLLWAEVRIQHKDLETKPVCICDDWSLCWVDEDAGIPATISSVIIRGAPEEPTEEGDTHPTVRPRRRRLLH